MQLNSNCHTFCYLKKNNLLNEVTTRWNFFFVFLVYNSTPFSKLVLIKKDCNIYINYEYSLKNVGNSLTPLLMSVNICILYQTGFTVFIHSNNEANCPRSILLYVKKNKIFLLKVMLCLWPSETNITKWMFIKDYWFDVSMNIWIIASK